MRRSLVENKLEHEQHTCFANFSPWIDCHQRLMTSTNHHLKKPRTMCFHLAKQRDIIRRSLVETCFDYSIDRLPPAPDEKHESSTQKQTKIFFHKT